MAKNSGMMREVGRSEKRHQPRDTTHCPLSLRRHEVKSTHPVGGGGGGLNLVLSTPSDQLYSEGSTCSRDRHLLPREKTLKWFSTGRVLKVCDGQLMPVNIACTPALSNRALNSNVEVHLNLNLPLWLPESTCNTGQQGTSHNAKVSSMSRCEIL